jgi:hypothetical protein
MKRFFSRILPLVLMLVVLAPAAFGQGWSGCDSYDDYLHWASRLALGGTARDVAVNGDYAYVLTEYNLNVLDVSDRANPLLVRSIVTSYSLNKVIVSGDRLFIVFGDGLMLYSLADPTMPVLVSEMSLGGARSVSVSGNIAVVARLSNGVTFVDYSHPSAPVIRGSANNSYYYYDVVADGALAYVVATGPYYWNNYPYLEIIDFSDPSSPVVRADFSVASGPSSISKSGNIVLVGCSSAVQFIDVTIPTAPVSLSTYSVSESVTDVRLDAARAWVACGWSGIVALDASNPRYPTPVGRLDSFDYVCNLDVVGHDVYVANNTAGLAVMSSTTDASPPVVGRWTIYQQVARVAAQANMLYTITTDGRMWAIDCADPRNPVQKSWLDTNYSETRLALGGRYAFLATPNYGLRVADIGNPAQMQMVGSLSFSGARDVAYLGDKVYVATDYSLKIIDVSTPTSPVLVSELSGANGNCIAADGRYVVIGYGTQLTVINVADPTRPRMLGTLTLAETIQDVELVGSRATAAVGGVGLVVVDIANPASPVIAGIGDTPGSAVGLSVSGNVVAVSDASSGIILFDLQDVAHPRIVGSILESGGSYDVSLQADYLFSATYSNSATLYSAPCPSLNKALISAVIGSVEDSGNLAAVRNGATAGFDPGLEANAPPPAPGAYVDVSFYHPEWGSPLGDTYGADIRPPYDLDTAYDTWPIRVETNQSGTVTVRVAPNFGIGTGWGPWLRDLVSGRFVGLGPDYEYTYESIGTADDPDVRDFELVMGGQYGIPPLTPENRSLPAGWSLVGLPLMPQYGLQALDDILLGDATGQTYLYSYNANGDYVPRSGLETVSAVEGLWVGAMSPFTWDMSGIPAIIGVSMPLRRGWNMVGYPLWIGTDVAGIQVDYNGSRYTWQAAVAQGLVAGSFFDYDGVTQVYQTATMLSTWHGYWLAAYQDNISLWFDYRNATTNLKFAEQCKVADTSGDWSLPISSKDGKARIVIGGDSRATQGFDALLDLPSPPSSPGAKTTDVGLAIDHTPWDIITGTSFLADFVSPACSMYAWEIRVKARGATSVELRWDPELLPASGEVDLWVPSTGQILVSSLRNASSCLVPLINGRQIIEVRLNAQASPVGTVPAATSLGANFPNPFNPSTTIACDLAAPSRVSLQVFDASGRLVRVLAAGQDLTAGHHELTWNGRDDAGRAVAGGVYFYRLDAGSYHETRKMTLVK